MVRYATIITGDDGREVVSAIGEFEGAAPRARLGRVEQVPARVLIGMVLEADGRFGFPRPDIDGQSIGLVRARLLARAGRAAGTAKPAVAARPARAAKGRKRSRKKTVRSKKPARPAKAAVAAGNAGQVNG